MIFPQLNSAGMLAQLPTASSQSFLTVSAQQPNGMRYSRAARTSPLCRWTLQYPSLTDAELEALQEFYEDCGGGLSGFKWLDPGGNLVKYSEDYTDASWERSNLTVGSAVADPFGGTSARSITTPGTLTLRHTLPSLGGDSLAGFILTGSIWLRSPSGWRQCICAVEHNGSHSASYVSVGSSWVRLVQTVTVTGTASPAIYVTSDGNIHAFGAQLVALPGPGAYVKTPGNWAWHEKCRFDNDAFIAKLNGPDNNAVTVAITEYA